MRAGAKSTKQELTLIVIFLFSKPDPSLRQILVIECSSITRDV